MDKETPAVTEKTEEAPRHGRRKFLAMAGAVTGVGVGAAVAKLGALPGAASPAMETRSHPMADWRPSDISRIQSAELVNGKPELMQPLVYGARGHDPRERSEPERIRVLALLGALKRAWEYPAVMQSFDRDPGGFIAASAPLNIPMENGDFIRLLKLPPGTEVKNLDRKQLASSLKLKAPHDETPHVVFTLMSILHSHPLLASECK